MGSVGNYRHFGPPQMASSLPRAGVTAQAAAMQKTLNFSRLTARGESSRQPLKAPMSAKGHSRPSQLAPKSADVRYCLKATIRWWMSEASASLPIIEIT